MNEEKKTSDPVILKDEVIAKARAIYDASMKQNDLTSALAALTIMAQIQFLSN